MSQTPPAASNRRDSYRRRPKDDVRITCRRAADPAGKDFAVALLDASQTGLRLLVRRGLTAGEEVTLELEGRGCPGLRRSGVVTWSVPDESGNWSAGIRLHERLPYRALIRFTELQ
jgi:hypothetical protein